MQKSVGMPRYFPKLGTPYSGEGLAGWPSYNHIYGGFRSSESKLSNDFGWLFCDDITGLGVKRSLRDGRVLEEVQRIRLRGQRVTLDGGNDLESRLLEPK